MIRSSYDKYGIGTCSADTTLAAKLHCMSELLDKQMNAQKESLKKLLGFIQAPTSP